VGIGRAHTATAHSIWYPPEESLHKEGARWVGLRGCRRGGRDASACRRREWAIGRPLVAQLVNAGHTLVGMIHSDRAAQLVGAVGAEPVVADALDAAAVEHAGRSVRPEAMRDTLAASN